MKNIIFFILSAIISVPSIAVDYYVNDAAGGADAATSGLNAFSMIAGNDANPGTLASPKQTIGSLIGTLVAGDRVFIQAGTYNEELLLSGKNGAAGNLISFIGLDSLNTIIRSLAGGTQYAVQLENSNYIRWQNLRIIGEPGIDKAINIFRNSDHNEVIGCSLMGYYGVDILRNVAGSGPDFNIVRNCKIFTEFVGIRIKSNRIGAETWTAAGLVGPEGNEVYDNNVRVQAVDVFSALELQAVRNNLIYRNKFSANGRTIEGTIHIASHSSGNLLLNNYITHETAPTLPAFINAAIEIDDNSGVDIFHNSIYSVGDAFHLEGVVEGTQTPANATLTNVALENNILYSLSNNCIEIPNEVAKFKSIKNNMYYAPGGSLAVTGTSTLPAVNRNFASWKAYNPDGSGIGDLNSLNTDPQYINPAISNLNLGNSSPAIDAVIDNIASVVHDIYLIARPYGPAKDIGAFEWTNFYLPVNLISFNASCLGAKVELNWATSTEANNDYFIVERSIDGIHFNAIATVDGAGNSNKFMSYIYTDSYDGKAYYRLKQIDYDGTFSYSNISYSGCGSELNQIDVFVESGNITVNVVGDAQECTITLYTQLGQILLHQTHEMEKQVNTFQINNYGIADHLYIVQVVAGGQVFSKKILFSGY